MLVNYVIIIFHKLRGMQPFARSLISENINVVCYDLKLYITNNRFKKSVSFSVVSNLFEFPLKS